MIALYRTLVFAALAGLYLVFAGDMGAFELVAAFLCAGAGTMLADALCRVAHRHFGVAFAWRGLVRPLVALLPETLAVGRQLLAEIFGAGRGNRGAFVRQPFDPGRDDPPSATRRALAVIGISFAPGTFVIRGDRADVLLLHALPAKAASRDRRWPA